MWAMWKGVQDAWARIRMREAQLDAEVEQRVSQEVAEERLALAKREAEVAAAELRASQLVKDTIELYQQAKAMVSDAQKPLVVASLEHAKTLKRRADTHPQR
jgi:hypothetical protein